MTDTNTVTNKTLVSNKMFSYVVRNVGFKCFKDIQYIFEMDSSTLALYFGLKNKHNYMMTNDSVFINHMRTFLDVNKTYVIPESSSSLLKNILHFHNYIVFEKNTKDFIWQSLLSQKLCKDEKIAINNWFNEMGDNFQIHKLKTNKRPNTIPFLFKEKLVTYPEVTILDDICVSETTLKAIEYHLNKHGVKYTKKVLFLETNNR